MTHIRQFPLAWRWTQPTHAVLPNEVLQQLYPLGIAAAARLNKSLRLASDDLTVTPEDGSWLLFYSHEEVFEFGKRTTHNPAPRR